MRKEFEDIVRLFQRYKGAIRKIFASQGKLAQISLEGNRIVVWALNTKSLVRCDIVAHHPDPFEKVDSLRKALQVVKLVEEAFELLDERQAFVVFHRYVDHDFEKISTVKELAESDPGMVYKGMSLSEIAKRLGVSVRECEQILEEALGRVKEWFSRSPFTTEATKRLAK